MQELKNRKEIIQWLVTNVILDKVFGHTTMGHGLGMKLLREPVETRHQHIPLIGGRAIQTE
eukprot:3936440-Karenia_brevis.AAC.1